jgi:pimeloyl-ACP methyl ester carboxylesterase
MKTLAASVRTAHTRTKVLAAGIAAVVAVSLAIPAAVDAHGTHHPTGPKPTIVLVHGAFADSSGWSKVVKKLQREEFTVYAVSNPLRGIPTDAAYVRSFLETIPGPIVLVGHSYGGAVITNAATGNENVKALVYINAFALDEGENVQTAIGLGGGSSELAAHIVARPFPGAAEGDADAYIDPAYFRELFCADLSASTSAVLAASQRPAALASLAIPSGEPAWRTIPSWYLASTHDNTIPVEAERFMAERAGAHTIEIDSSHVAMMSHPSVVTKVILSAVRGTSK